MRKNFQWLIVGAGPGGIAAVGQLLDSGVSPDQIVWVDPVFSAGDFGTVWKKIVSNTPVDGFMKYYKAFHSFSFDKPHPTFMIERMRPEMRCPLALAAEPLQWITGQLRGQVTSFSDLVIKLAKRSSGWEVTLASGREISSQSVILALGGEAKTLPYAHLETIPLTVVADKTKLAQAISPTDVIAVFGSYQSARTVQENLMATEAKKILHFYRSARSFERHVGSLDLPPHVVSYPITTDNLLRHTLECNKAIYAVGFARRHIPIVGLPEDYDYDGNTGIIAPGIYGLGMSFPEIIPHTMGRLEYRVTAVWPFVKHLKKVFPMWVGEKRDEPRKQLMA